MKREIINYKIEVTAKRWMNVLIHAEILSMAEDDSFFCGLTFFG